MTGMPIDTEPQQQPEPEHEDTGGRVVHTEQTVTERPAPVKPVDE